MLNGLMPKAAPTNVTSYLVAIAGPPLDPIALTPKAEGLTLGPHANWELLLPADAERVSRFHARFAFVDGAGWRITDLGSRWGTFLNGVKVAGGRELPLSDGDLIRISPWTFSLSPTPKRRGMSTRDDTGQTMVRAHQVTNFASAKDDALGLILETAAALHEAADEQQLAERVMDAAC